MPSTVSDRNNCGEGAIPLWGSRIRELMDERGVTISDLARLVGVERSHISNILASRKQPSIGLALRISRVLGVTVNDLIDRDRYSLQERSPKK